MTAVGSTVYTSADLAKRIGPDQKEAIVIDLMTKTNRIMEDVLWKEGNLPTGHRTTVRDGLPASYYRLFNQGVTPSKDATRQVDEQCGILTNFMVVDKDLAELNGMQQSFMVSQAKPRFESMTQTVASTLFYGDSRITPEAFHGFGPRYPYKNSPNVIDFGDTGSNCTSIYLVGWGEDTCHMIFPKASKAGIDVHDFGLVTALDGDNKEFPAYKTMYSWKHGLCIADWRYVVRICNIDVSDFTGDDITDALIDAYHLIPNPEGVKMNFYLPRALMGAIDKQAKDKGNAYYTQNNVFGKPVTSFWETPLRRCDALLTTETALVAAP